MTYVPVAGLTIKEALSRAIKLSKDNKQPVMAIINDVVIILLTPFDSKIILQS